MTLYHDAPDSEQNPNNILRTDSVVKASDKLDLDCAPTGGLAAIIKARK